MNKLKRLLIPLMGWMILAGVPAGCAGRAGIDRETAAGSMCQDAAQSARPALAGWTAGESASLQSLVRDGIAVVAFDGCSLELLDGCRLPGRYLFEETVRSKERVSIRNEETLLSKLPLGALELSPVLLKGNSLEYVCVTAGTRVARIDDSSRGMLEGDCDRATHFVKSMVLGAYALSSLSGSNESVLRAGGDADKCEQRGTSSTSDECQAIVQLVLLPINEMVSDREELYKTSEADEEDLRARLMALAASAQELDPELLGEPAVTPSTSLPPELDESELSEVSRQIRTLPDGGSDPWDDAVSPIIVAGYDADGSNAIDTPEEVSSIPCDVFITMDRSIRIGRGGVSSLRSTYGFPPDYHWVGYALGFDEKIRASADEKIASCGL